MKFASSAALALALVFAAGSAFAADTAPAKPLTPQQQKMKDCNAQAGDKKGDDRKTFMSTCLKGSTTAATPVAPAAPAKPLTQQEKMKNCNINASGQHMTGDARTSYMSTCLKGDGALTPASH